MRGTPTRMVFCLVAAPLFWIISIPAGADGRSSCKTCSKWECEDRYVIKHVQQALLAAGEDVEISGHYESRTRDGIAHFAEKNAIANFEPRSNAFLRKLLPKEEFAYIRARIFASWNYGGACT
jgi:hypothetical protein